MAPVQVKVQKEDKQKNRSSLHEDVVMEGDDSMTASGYLVGEGIKPVRATITC